MKKNLVQASSVPCVHCGSVYNYLACHGGARLDGSPVNLAFHVACQKCRANGPIAETAAEAVKGWEHRAAPRRNEEPPALLPEIEFESDDDSAEDEPDLKGAIAAVGRGILRA